jgi:hypothetical protein
MAVAELDGATRQTYEGYIRRTIVPTLGSMELRKVRGPVLDMLYARLHRCGDLACSGKPFTDHSSFPAIDVTPAAARPIWVQVALVIREAIAAGRLSPGESLPSARQLAHRNGPARDGNPPGSSRRSQRRPYWRPAGPAPLSLGNGPTTVSGRVRQGRRQGRGRPGGTSPSEALCQRFVPGTHKGDLSR